MFSLRFLLALFLVGGRLGWAQAVSFLAPVSNVVGIAQGPAYMWGVAVADFNGDGKPDVVYSATVEVASLGGVLLGNGDGTFRPGSMLPALEYQSVLGPPFAGDFNGDGKPDVAILSGPSVWIYLGDGTGNFSAPIAVPACPSISVVSDLNGDGKSDLVCGTSVLLSNGNGTFSAAPALDGQAVLAADFNQDGKTDLLLTNGGGQFAVVLGQGSGSFSAEIPLASSPVVPFLAGDFTSQGHVDLAGESFDAGKIVVLPGHGDGSFGSAIATPAPLQFGLPGLISAAADFNRDGNLDLMVGDSMFAGNGDGTFRFPVFIGVVSQPCSPMAIPPTPCTYTRAGTAVADFNGDGLPDVAAGYAAPSFSDEYNFAAVSVLSNDSPGDGFTATGVSSNEGLLPIVPDSYVSGYGSNLAPGSETASGNLAPDTLGGIRLHVRDRSHATEFLAPLLYVSPTQINYILDSTDPWAWVAVELVGTPYMEKGMTVPLALPASALDIVLYTLGNGLAAATAVSVAPGGSQTPVPVTSCSGSNCTSVPIDVSGNPVYLSLYGTGFAQSGASNTNCYGANTLLPVTYAGTQNNNGLDQINVLLPKSLAGAGETSIVCEVGLVSSNAVMVNIQ